GADVPFFIFNRPALACGIGEELTSALEIQERWNILLIYPGFSASTREVYKNVNLRLTNPKKKITNAILKKEKVDLINLMQNDLEISAFKLYPKLQELKDAFCNTESIKVLMTGSGSCMFGLFKDTETLILAKQQLEPVLKEYPLARSYQVYLLT
ncbi:MAG: hypothetical protein HQK77_04440, partial [Desulfobacterales bacterium]|nr:hypothetical protein [Desulfobacterales bacterium]